MDCTFTNTRKTAFTLAEVLITLGIIGVVAAMTMPSLIKNYHQKSYDRAMDVFHKKLTEATRQMNVADRFTGYSSTEDFVEEFKKYMKIAEVCEPGKADKCFAPVLKYQNGETFDTKDIRTSENLGNISYGTNALGMTFNNGYTMVLAYNSNCPPIEVTNNQTDPASCLSLLYDVNGNAKPNQLGRDIKAINAVVSPNSCIDLGGGICIAPTVLAIIPIDVTLPENRKWDTKCNNSRGSACYTNYWAGAKKQCDEMGMRIPTEAELDYIDRKTRHTIGLKGYFWTDEDRNGESHTDCYMYACARMECMGGSCSDSPLKSNASIQAICVK